MNLNVGDRLLIKLKDGDFREIDVIEIWGDYIKAHQLYPEWQLIDNLQIEGKLPKKESINIRRSLLLQTEGLTCPLTKSTCNRQCSWFVQHSKSCIILQLSEDINTAVDDET